MSFYMIKSRISDFVLDAEGGGAPGNKILTFRRQESDNQIFYDDNSTGTIRVKQGNYCLDLQGDQLIVNNYQAGNPNQQWMRDGQFIRNRSDRNKVLDIFDFNREQGAKVGAWQFNGGENQQFEFIPVGGGGGSAGYYPSQGASTQRGGQFYIMSMMNNKVLDISGGNQDEGAQILMWDKHPNPEKNQLWYTDNMGCIRSALNDMTIHGQEGQNIMTKRSCNDAHCCWSFQGDAVVSRAGTCLDIVQGNKDNGAAVCAYKRQGSENQRWRQAYV